MQYRRLFAATLLLSSVAGQALAGELPAGDRPNAIRLKARSEQGLATRLEKWGKIAFAEGRGTYIVVPRHGQSATAVAKHLRQQGFSAVAESCNRIVPAEAKQEEAKPRGHELEYEDAYREMVRVRAYPFAQPDPLQSTRARAQRDRMAAYTPPASAGNVVEGGWSLLGPTAMPTPYRQYFGPGAISGRVNAIAIRPGNNNISYIATACGGLWRTENGGTNWTPCSQDWPSLNTSAVAIDPSNPEVVYVGTGDVPGDQRGVLDTGYGIFRSPDGGLTWTLLGASTFRGRKVSDIWVDPTDGRKLVVTTGSDSDGSIFRSTDSGETWLERTTVGANYTSLSYGANRSGLSTGYLYAASGNDTLGSSYILRSTTMGNTWTTMTRPTNFMEGGVVVAASKVFPEVVYALYPTAKKVFKSTNAGSTWLDITSGLPGPDDMFWNQNTYKRAIETTMVSTQNGPQDAVYVSVLSAARSLNGGQTWDHFGNCGSLFANIHSDQHAIAVSPTDPNYLMLGNDGGVYRHLVSDNSVTSLNRTLSISQFYWADWDDSDMNNAIGGTQDNSTPWMDQGVWKNVVGGDGGGAWIDPRNNHVMFAGDQASVVKTDTSWLFSGRLGINWAPSESNHFVVPIVADPNNFDRLYTASLFLHRIDNVFNGGSTRLPGPNAASAIKSIEVARGDSNRIYCGEAGVLWMSTDAGATWADIAPGISPLPNRVFLGLSVNPNNKNDVVVVVSGGGSNHVYRCQDVTQGNATRVWTPRDGPASGPTTFPDTPANCIARDIFDPLNTWYVGTDVGVFMTRDAGGSWYNMTAPLGLPNAPVTAIEAVRNSGYLNVATFGRGMWRIFLRQDPPTVQGVTASGSVRNSGLDFLLTATLTRPAPFPDMPLLVQGGGPVIVPQVIRVAAGQRSVQFYVRARDVETSTPATVTVFANEISRSVNLTVRPVTLSSLSFFPNSILGGLQLRGRAGLRGVPANNFVVTLSANSQNVSLPQSLTFTKGVASLDFNILTRAVSKNEQITIVAESARGKVFGTFDLLAPILQSLATNKKQYKVLETGQLTVSLTSPAPKNGMLVNLAASPSDGIVLPATALVPEGETTVVVEFGCKKARNMSISGGTTTTPTAQTTFKIVP